MRSDDAASDLLALIADLGGMDLYVHCSGIGCQNMELNPGAELNTIATNVDGFVRLVDCAFSYFLGKGGGHLCIISSIAGTKGLGATSAYSASKAFQNTYLDALEQLSVMRKCPITFTDVRPGFVDTDLLADGKSYSFKMNVTNVASSIVKGIETKKRVLVIDWKYKLLVFSGAWCRSVFGSTVRSRAKCGTKRHFRLTASAEDYRKTPSLLFSLQAS